jgi:hypothetical protein
MNKRNTASLPLFLTLLASAGSVALLRAVPALASVPQASARPNETPRPSPSPIPCPQTAGLKIGQTRSEVSEMISRPVGNEVELLHQPKERRYQVEIRFSAKTAEATVISLHYVFATVGDLRSGIEQRYGKPDEGALPKKGLWRIAHCGVALRYEQTGEGREEMWVEPLPVKTRK